MTATHRLPSQFLRFAAVGVAGLVVDVVVLFVAAPVLGWYAGRVVSFLAAATATWWLNRRFTFVPAQGATAQVHSIWREYGRYLVSMLGGAALNYVAYALTLQALHGPFAPAVGVALGSLAGMFANFASARYFVFRTQGTARLRPLATWPATDRAGLVGVFTDIDDTLTTDGAITPDALQAIADLKAQGLHVIAITGRPVGWSKPFARAWPVDAIVAENGAVALIAERGADGAVELAKRYQQDEPTRTANFARMQQVLARIEREIPGARRATDSAGRECDIAIDHSEFVHLEAARIEAVVALMRSEGMHATVSSIHINGWYGEHDKLVGARWIVRELFGRTLEAEVSRWAYVGDSTNDQLMFEAFDHSVGVANIARFVPVLSHLPHYVAPSERGAGFTEVARAILSVR